MPPQLRAEPVIDDETRDAVPVTPHSVPVPTPSGAGPDTAGDRRRFALDLTGPTRVAMVGAGYIADYHLEVLAGRPDVQVVAVCDTDRGRAESAAARFKVPHAVDSVDALAGLGVQVAHVLVPPDLHVLVTRRLLALGIGALVEKPLALSEADARGLQRQADERRLPLAVNHNNVYHPAFARLLAQVREGRIGRLEHVRVCLSVPLAQLESGDVQHWMFRAPRNILFEQAVHPLSQVHALLGPVRSAHATRLGTRELTPGQVFHDRWLIGATAERGGTAEVFLSFGNGFPRSTIEVLGSDGSLEADLLHDLLAGEEKTAWLEFWNSFLAGTRRARALASDATRVLYRYGTYTLGIRKRDDAYYAGMRDSILDFYTALQSGAALPADGARAAEVLAWCDAAAAGVSAEPVRRPVLPRPGAARPGEVVVLGGTGFIGRRVVEGLLDRGLPVTVVTRRRDGFPPRIEEAAVQGAVRVLPASLEDRESLRKAIAGADVVVHLATGKLGTWDVVQRSMVDGSAAVGEACLEHGVRRLIYVSSIASLYCGPDGAPLVDDSVATDPKPGARDVYGRGKIEAERALLKLHRERGLPLVIARPGVVLGDGTPMQHSGFGLWVRDNQCVGWGKGDHPLPVVGVDDVADALVRMAVHPGKDLDGKALNLCANVPLTAAEAVAELQKSTGRALAFRPRSLRLSYLLEIGKWVVKKAGRKPGRFPSARDLKTRALAPRFTARTAREVLGWRPVEDREAFLDRYLRCYGRSSPETRR
jgi:predicted dehydrogenase/nucleoside-diphosphate-sugar epimerase